MSGLNVLVRSRVGFGVVVWLMSGVFNMCFCEVVIMLVFKVNIMRK